MLSVPALQPPHQRLVLFSAGAAKHFYLAGYSTQEHAWRVLTFKVEGLELKITQEIRSFRLFEDLQAKLSESSGASEVCRGHCLLGVVLLQDLWHALIVVKRRKVGQIMGSYIYSVEKTQLVPLGDGPRWSSLEASRARTLFQQVDLSKGFFFSDTYDVTSTLQAAAVAPCDGLPPARPVHDMFVWNTHLMAPLLDAAAAAAAAQAAGAGKGGERSWDAGDWCTPVVHGFFAQRFVRFEASSCGGADRGLRITLLARRSRHFAGTRYLRRGVDRRGYCANEVESEQIIEATTAGDTAGSGAGGWRRVSAVVQLRGSIPVPWSHVNIMQPRPDVEIGPNPGYRATRLHFERLCQFYGPRVVILSLIKQAEVGGLKEVLLGDAFGAAVAALTRRRKAHPPKATSSPKAERKKSGGDQSVAGAFVLEGAHEDGKQGGTRAEGTAAVAPEACSSSSAVGRQLTAASAAASPAASPAREAASSETASVANVGTKSFLKRIFTPSEPSGDVEEDAAGSSGIPPLPATTLAASAAAAAVSAASAAQERGVSPATSPRNSAAAAASADAEALDSSSEPPLPIEYLTYDFLNSSKKRDGAGVFEALEHIGSGILPAVGFFCCGGSGSSGSGGVPPHPGLPPRLRSGASSNEGTRLQFGILRTNCVDCLDRTNVAQFTFGRVCMKAQLRAMGVTTSAQLLAELSKVLMDLYASHGDQLAKQYGGSGAMHRVDERVTGEAGSVAASSASGVSPSEREFILTGGAKNALLGLQRYYSNTMTDGERQDAIDLFLGITPATDKDVPPRILDDLVNRGDNAAAATSETPAGGDAAAARSVEAEMRERDETEARLEQLGQAERHPPLRRRLLQDGGRKRGPFWSDSHLPTELTGFDEICAFDFNVSCLDAAALELLEALPEPKGLATAAMDAFLTDAAAAATAQLEASAAEASREAEAATSASSAEVLVPPLDSQEAIYARYIANELLLTLGESSVAGVPRSVSAVIRATTRGQTAPATTVPAITKADLQREEQLRNATLAPQAEATQAAAIRATAAPAPLRPGARAQLLSAPPPVARPPTGRGRRPSRGTTPPPQGQGHVVASVSPRPQTPPPPPQAEAAASLAIPGESGGEAVPVAAAAAAGAAATAQSALQRPISERLISMVRSVVRKNGPDGGVGGGTISGEVSGNAGGDAAAGGGGGHYVSFPLPAPPSSGAAALQPRPVEPTISEGDEGGDIGQKADEAGGSAQILLTQTELSALLRSAVVQALQEHRAAEGVTQTMGLEAAHERAPLELESKT